MELNLTNVTIERCNKETEEVIAKEEASVLKTPLNQLKQNQDEFLYIESPSFKPVKTEALSLELDDVFKTYMVLFGFKVQKKHIATIKTYLEENLRGEEIINYSAMFSNEDGMWDLNIPLDFMEGFNEEMTIEEAIVMVYYFVDSLLKQIE